MPSDKEGRRLLGGTGAATATLDWGESRALQTEIALGCDRVYSKRGTVQPQDSGVMRTKFAGQRAG